MIFSKGTDEAKLIVVIETKSMRGDGSEKEPVRIVTQYWDLVGNLLAEHDEIPC